MSRSQTWWIGRKHKPETILKFRAFCGPLASNWKGGRILISDTGYVKILKKGHPRANPKGYVFEHILVAEEMLGRSLMPKEIVHHLNHNRSDNRPENLEIMTRSQHARMHLTERHAKRREERLHGISH